MQRALLANITAPRSSEGHVCSAIATALCDCGRQCDQRRFRRNFILFRTAASLRCSCYAGKRCAGVPSLSRFDPPPSLHETTFWVDLSLPALRQTPTEHLPSLFFFHTALIFPLFRSRFATIFYHQICTFFLCISTFSCKIISSSPFLLHFCYKISVAFSFHL